MKRSYSLNTEFLVTLCIIIGAAMVFSAFLAQKYTEKILYDERINHLNSLVLVIHMNDFLDEGKSAFSNSQDGIEFLDTLVRNQRCTRWILYDKSGKVLDEFKSGGEALFPRASFFLAVSSGEILSTVKSLPSDSLFGNYDVLNYLIPVRSNGVVSGAVELQFSLLEIRRFFLSSTKLFLIYFFIFWFVPVSAGFFLLRRSVSLPAKHLLSAIDAVGHGTFDTELPEEGPSEFVRLSSSYNQMITALRDSRQRADSYIGSLEQMNRQLSVARNDLIRQEKITSVGQFAAGVAHEIGNPLSAIIGYLDLLKGEVCSEQGKAMVDNSVREAARIDFLIKEILDFAKPSGAALPEAINLVDELRYCISLLMHQSLMANISVVDALPLTLPAALGRREMVRQVFINILLNAADACGLVGKIILSSSVGQEVSIIIEDNGCGMSPEALNRIFDPFYTTKSPGKGMGLGLAISQQFMDECGGRIDVESQVGKGSRFILMFQLFE